MESKRRFFSPFMDGGVYIPADLVEEFRWDSTNGYWKITCSNGKSYGSDRCIDEMEPEMGVSIQYVGEEAPEPKKDVSSYDSSGGIVW